MHETGDVWHFGVSGAWREIDSAYKGANASLAATSPTYPVGAVFETRPSARARNTAMLVSTRRANGGNPIRANNVRMFNVEMARQCGPFMLEGEYTSVFVHRIQDALSLGNLRFDGWNVQTRYLLTGESHQYDVRDGNFGAVKPNSSYGAVEVAARYDFLDLNDKDVRGGSEHDITLGLNWFINQQVRLSANYLHQVIRPANYGSVKRNLDTIGLRCQIRFK